MLAEMTDRIKLTPGFDLTVSDEVVDYILEKGYQPQYGARPLRRTIQNEVEDFLADEFLKGNIKRGSKKKLVLVEGKMALE
jgi:ATP-dependent Clp protease ATP-binding subunit ClpA